MKNKKYLPLYYKWMKTGKLPQVSSFFTGGLCGAGLSDDPLFRLFIPEGVEASNWGVHYWGYSAGEGKSGSTERDVHLYAREFTSYRQTIVLFLAAMNDEL